MNRQLALSITLVFALPLRAQTTPGYSPQSAAAEHAAEADVISRPSPSSASAHSKFLSFQPQMAGTSAQARTRDYVVSQMKSWGLETEVRSYSVWMPHPLSTRVWRIATGLIEDYAQLDSMGVSVKGKIAIARYGRSYRGIKAREAEKHGAVGLMIYSDPADDGYVRGDVSVSYTHLR